MSFEEYLDRFRILLHAAEKDERTLKLLEGQAYRSFFQKFGSSRDPVLASFLFTEAELKKNAAVRRRLAERYARRIALACQRMESVELREYAVCHYLYGMTYEEIAERSGVCTRTVYRRSVKARKALEAALSSVMPRPRRMAPGRFRLKGSLSLRKYAWDHISRSVAFLRARKRHAAPLSAGRFCLEKKPLPLPFLA